LVRREIAIRSRDHGDTALHLGHSLDCRSLRLARALVANGAKMRVTLKIRTPETERQLGQLRCALSWSIAYLFGVALTLLLVFVIMETFGR